MATFFHVHTLDQAGGLQPGATLGLNPPQSLSASVSGRLLSQWFPGGLTGFGATCLSNPFDPNTKAIETLWEAVRRLGYANAPSRLNTLFAWSSLDDARAFESSYRRHASTVVYEVDGNCRLRANMPLLLSPSEGAVAIANAHDYWSGRRGNAAELWECLLEFPVQVVRQVP